MTTPNTPRVAEIDEDSIGYEGPVLPRIVFGKPTPAPENWLKDYFGPWLEDEAPTQANQLIPTAWVMNAIDREATSTTKPHHDNEAAPTETKMDANEINSASEANENEEFPVTEASIKEREDIYGVHTAKKPAKPLWICEPAGIGRVISTSASHAREMAKKAVAIAAANAG